MGEADDRFDHFHAQAEPRLRRALVAAYGPGLGRESAFDALSWAWANWERLEDMENPIGYLFRVGQTAASRQVRQQQRERLVSHAAVVAGATRDGDVATTDLKLDADLHPALDNLSVQQRTAVVLVHGFGIPLREVAETMEISVATVREHTRRALENLRTTMEESDV